jgi:lysylphosphatidylglycerol synthetase-like protein (DUF2156 family)
MVEETRVVIEHPNREKASSRVTKATIVLLLVISAGLMLIVTAGGWDALQGAKAVTVGFILLYVVIAFAVSRWSRGVLPLAAALAIFVAIFSAVAAPGWFDRDAEGFAQPAVDAGTLGMVCVVLAGVQVVLIVFALRGFVQAWGVEVDHCHDPPPRVTAQSA